jgi:hypothetical protein
MADLSTRYCRGCRQNKSLEFFELRSNGNRYASCQMCRDRQAERQGVRRRANTSLSNVDIVRKFLSFGPDKALHS